MVTERRVMLPTTVGGLSAVDPDARIPVLFRSANDVESEVDDAFADMRTFHNREPDEIMRMATGHSARLSELRVQCLRVERKHPEWERMARALRMDELEPCLEELRNQWQGGSRLHTVRELDWKMESGER